METSTFQFLELPRELRGQIYGHVLVAAEPIDVRRAALRALGSLIPVKGATPVSQYRHPKGAQRVCKKKARLLGQDPASRILGTKGAAKSAY